jgi:hypothetical protein
MSTVWPVAGSTATLDRVDLGRAFFAGAAP